MKKTISFVLLFVFLICSTSVSAQGRKRIRIIYRNAKHLVEKIKANPNAETLYLFRNGLDSLPDEIGQLKNLKKLVLKIDTDKMNEPAFMMVLTAIGDFAFRRSDGVWIVPISALKP